MRIRGIVSRVVILGFVVLLTAAPTTAAIQSYSFADHRSSALLGAHVSNPAPSADIAGPHESSSNSVANNGSANVTELTLLTGQKVMIVDRGNRTAYVVNADVPMHRIDTSQGTYIFPHGIDFDRFDPALFNVDFLRRQNLTDGEAGDFPVIVRFESPMVTVNERGLDHPGLSVADRLGVQGEQTLESLNAVAGRINKTHAAETYANLRSSDRVRQVYLDVKVRVQLDQVNSAISAPSARATYNVSGENITVAVLDTGVDESHPDLDEGTERLELDFTTDNTTNDTVGHGTHVAGIITGDGEASNGTYVGVAPNASIMDLRVLNSQGFGFTSWIIDAMEFAIANDADVVSMSLGALQQVPRSRSPFTPVVDRAVGEGTIVVISAGNAGPDHGTVSSPAIVENAISVGATNTTGEQVVGFSSRGPTRLGFFLKPDVVAPGTDIRSAASSAAGFEASYVNFSGTSMAAPAVSGTVALLLEARPGLTADEVKDVLITTADPLDRSDTSVYAQGGGQIDAADAIRSDIFVSPGTLDFGLLTNRTTASAVVTVHNVGNRSHTLPVDARATDILSGDAGNVTLNRTTVTVPANGTASIELEVNVTDDVGIFSGRLSFDDTYTTSFGYAHGYEVTVRKEPLSTVGQTVENDPVVVLSHRSRFFAAPRLDTLRNGTSTFTSFGGNLTVFSLGIDDATKGPIELVRTVTVSSDTTIVLDEDDTVRYELDASNIEATVGPLATLALETNVQKRFTVVDGMRSIEIGTVATPQRRRVARFSEGVDLNASVEYLLVPGQALVDATALLDVPRAYHLTYGTAGVTGPQTFTPETDRLASIDVTYYRTYAYQTYASIPFGWVTRWPERTDIAIPVPIGTREIQRIRVTSGTLHAVGATGTERTHHGPAEWALLPLYRYHLRPGNAITQPINRQPMLGRPLAWSLADGTLDFTVAFQADQGLAAHDTNASANTIRVLFDGEVESAVDVSTPVVGTAHPFVVDPNTTVRVETIGRNPVQPRSTVTNTTYLVEYRPGRDNTPPTIAAVDVRELRLDTTVPADRVTVVVTVNDGGGNVTLSALVSQGGPSAPFENTTGARGWQSASVIRSSPGLFVVRFDAARFDGPIDLALEAIDERGNAMRIVVRDAVDVSGTAGPGDVTGNGKPATDPDGDGLYEDVDGDGQATFGDAVELAFLPGQLTDEQEPFFDFDGDGELTFDDAIELAFTV